MVVHAPNFVRYSITICPVDVSWYFRYPVWPFPRISAHKWCVKQCTHDASEQPVIRQELKARWLNVRLEPMQFHAVPIVNEDVFRLCDRKVRLVV